MAKDARYWRLRLRDHRIARGEILMKDAADWVTRGREDKSAESRQRAHDTLAMVDAWPVRIDEAPLQEIEAELDGDTESAA